MSNRIFSLLVVFISNNDEGISEVSGLRCLVPVRSLDAREVSQWIPVTVCCTHFPTYEVYAHLNPYFV